ncbi:hypothetical protein Aglo01_34990 [Actinokineospora globicatena]|nr:hypothetical protein Aglo01_34990 [Actinokineospora globicatena]GLW86572.1 hypothetical protein Aglo02_42110 [Actinokineospora globicatena]
MFRSVVHRELCSPPGPLRGAALLAHLLDKPQNGRVITQRGQDQRAHERGSGGQCTDRITASGANMCDQQIDLVQQTRLHPADHVP